MGLHLLGPLHDLGTQHYAVPGAFSFNEFEGHVARLTATRFLIISKHVGTSGVVPYPHFVCEAIEVNPNTGAISSFGATVIDCSNIATPPSSSSLFNGRGVAVLPDGSSVFSFSINSKGIVVGISPTGMPGVCREWWATNSTTGNWGPTQYPIAVDNEGNKDHIAWIEGKHCVGFFGSGLRDGGGSIYNPDNFQVFARRLTYTWQTDELTMGDYWQYFYSTNDSLTRTVPASPPPSSYVGYRGEYSAFVTYNTGDVVTLTQFSGFTSIYRCHIDGTVGIRPGAFGSIYWSYEGGDRAVGGGNDSPNPDNSCILENGVLGVLEWGIQVKPMRLFAVELNDALDPTMLSMMTTNNRPVDENIVVRMSEGKMGFIIGDFEKRNPALPLDNDNGSYTLTYTGTVQWSRSLGWHDYTLHTAPENVLFPDAPFEYSGSLYNPRTGVGPGDGTHNGAVVIWQAYQDSTHKQAHLEEYNFDTGTKAQELVLTGLSNDIVLDSDTWRLEPLSDGLLVWFHSKRYIQIIKRDVEARTIANPCLGVGYLDVVHYKGTGTGPCGLRLFKPSVEVVISAADGSREPLALETPIPAGGSVQLQLLNPSPVDTGNIIKLDDFTYRIEWDDGSGTFSAAVTEVSWTCAAQQALTGRKRGGGIYFDQSHIRSS